MSGDRTRAADHHPVVRPGVGLDVAAAADVPERNDLRARGSRCHRAACAPPDCRPRAVARPRPRVGPRQPDALAPSGGLALACLGLLLLARLDATSTIVDVIWRLVLTGLGQGLFLAPNTRALM